MKPREGTSDGAAGTYRRRAPRVGPVDDPTTLAGFEVNVAARMGWCARMTRLLHRPEPPRMEDIAAQCGTSTAQVHRMESGLRRSGRLLHGYEEVLGLPPGSLRAPVDVAFRCLPGGLVDKEPGTGLTNVSDLSALTERLLDPGEAVTGHDWMLWARTIAGETVPSLPERLARRLIDRLAGELSMAVAHAYPTRYEALSLVRCSALDHLTLEVIRERVATPYAQRLNDLSSAVSEQPDAAAAQWALGLLAGSDDRLVHTGAICLENMIAIDRSEQGWRRLAPPLQAVLRRSDPGSAARFWSARLLHQAPRWVWPDETPQLPPEDDWLPRVSDWTRTRRNPHWSTCEQLSREITSELGIPEQPMLARFLFEIVVSPFEVQAATSYLFLTAMPSLAGPVTGAVVALINQFEDEALNTQALRRLPEVLQGQDHPRMEKWFVNSDERVRVMGLRAASMCGHPVPPAVVEQALARGGDEATQCLLAMGTSGDPGLAEIAHDPARDAWTRGVAAWSLAAGGRITA